MSAELIVSHLRKQFLVGRPAVDDVSFRIAAGEIVVLLGPSRCGKTTALGRIAGLAQPTGGTISIGGDEVAVPERGVHVPPRARNIGMVFQSYAVWPHMTVRQNVNYPLRHRKVPREQADRKVDEVLDLVGLTEYSERPVTQLSGGQMQRVALARALVYEPRIPRERGSAARFPLLCLRTRVASSARSRSRTSTPSCACGCAMNCAASSR